MEEALEMLDHVLSANIYLERKFGASININQHRITLKQGMINKQY